MANLPVPTNLIQVPKPELGRATDRRVTQDYIDARPELAGFPAFVEGTDVDLVERFNAALAQVHSLVAYADPALREALLATIDTGTTELITYTDTIEARLVEVMAARDAAIASAGRIPWGGTAATIPMAAGYYQLTSSGEVYQREGGGTLTPRPALTAASRAEVEGVGARARVALLIDTFRSDTTALPRTPTATEVQLWADLGPGGPLQGSRRTAAAGIERLSWDGDSWEPVLTLASEAALNAPVRGRVPAVHPGNTAGANNAAVRYELDRAVGEGIGRVLLPAGTLAFGGEMAMPEGVELWGSGHRGTHLYLPTGGAAFRFDGLRAGGLRYLQIDAGMAAASQIASIVNCIHITQEHVYGESLELGYEVLNSYWCAFRNVQLNSVRKGWKLLSAANNVLLDTCNYFGGLANAEALTADDLTALNILNSCFEGKTGTLKFTRVNGLNLSGNYFEDDERRQAEWIQLGSGNGQAVQGALISGNQFNQGATYAITIAAASGVEITGNRLGTQYGVQLYQFDSSPKSNIVLGTNNTFDWDNGANQPKTQELSRYVVRSGMGLPTGHPNANAQVDVVASQAPTAGTWRQGDRVRNPSPAVQGAAGSQYVITGWLCTAEGTPGTWVPLRAPTGT